VSVTRRRARTGGLTASEVAERATRTSPTDRANRADVEGAESDIDRAKVDYFPRLTATARYTRYSNFTPPPIPRLGAAFPLVLDQYLLQANIIVPLSDYVLRIRQGELAAVSARDAAELNADASKRAVATEAKLLYYNWARARLGEVVTAQSVEQAVHHRELAKAARDAGRAPTADVLRAESLVSAAELADTRMKNAGILAEERLRTVMHDSRGSYEVGEDLLSPLAVADPGDPDALYREALTRRPEFRAMAASEASLRNQKSVFDARGLPRLDAVGNAYYANPNFRVVPPTNEWRATWDVGLQLVWSPSDFGANGAASRGLDAKRKRLDAERAALTDALRDEIAGARVAWLEARSAAETADRGLVASEEAYRVRRELYDLGRGTDVELIDAESDVLRARLEMIQARVDARVAKVRLEHAVGRDSRDGPSP
jgi:outer membrane protein TolC